MVGHPEAIHFNGLSAYHSRDLGPGGDPFGQVKAAEAVSSPIHDDCHLLLREGQLAIKRLEALSSFEPAHVRLFKFNKKNGQNSDLSRP